MAIPGAGSARFDLPEPSAHGEVVWLEPYPDVLLEGLGDPVPGPEARYESKQAISLAFVTAVQLLPPRQRAVLILRDVLGYRAADVAEFLDTTEESVTSALKRARAGMQQRAPRLGAQQPPPPPDSPAERQLIDRLTLAFESCDVDGVAALLADDVRLTNTPPSPDSPNVWVRLQGLDELAERVGVTGPAPGDQLRCHRIVLVSNQSQPAETSVSARPAGRLNIT